MGNTGEDIVPVCINRPSVSMFTPNEVVMTGFASGGLTAETGAIVPTSDAMTDLAVATEEESDRIKFNIFNGRKRREVDEEYCLENGGNRGLRANMFCGRKRRDASTCYAAEGDAMLFQYPTGQYILGGILQGEGQVEADDSNRGLRANIFGGRKRRDNSNVASLLYTNVLRYASWIYKTSGVWSKIEEQPAFAFNAADYSPQNWKGDYPEFGLADLSRSLEAVIDALPALQIINDNSVEQLVDILNSAPAANQASGLDQFLCESDGNRGLKAIVFGGRKRRSANNQCLCGSEQAVAGGDRLKANIFGGRKRRDAGNENQCLNLNLDDLPVCGMNGDRLKMNFNLGRKRREASEEQCIGDSNLGQFLGGLLDNNCDKKFNFNLGK